MREDFIFPKFNVAIISDTDMEHLGRLYTVDIIEPLIARMREENKKEKLWRWARQNFYNEDGSGWEMSPGEYAIYKTIVYRDDKWVEVITGTQYGKTQTIARAVLTRLVSYPGDILNVVPDQKRGEILLKYIINDTARNEFFSTKLQGLNIRENAMLMRLLSEHSRTKLTYQVIGSNNETFISSIEIITADAAHKNNAITTIMGFGGRTIISDESALVDDDIDSAIFRMLAGKGDDTFLCKVGNPFFRNHFLADWKNKDFKKIYVDYQIALAEGRYTEDFLKRAFNKPNADVFYRCEFPEQGAADTDGWMMLFTDEQIKMAMQEAPHFGEERMGCDPADEGTNESAIVKRSAGYAEILFHQAGIDPMNFSGNIILNADKIKDKRIYIDKVGIGAGVYSRVSEVNRIDGKGMTIVGVNAGEKEGVSDEYYNKRAEMFWRIRQWISSGGKLQPSPLWYQLANIPYRADSRGRIQIMPKKDMRSKKGLPSPDIADALSLTFYDSSLAPKMSEEEKFWYRKKMEKERQKKHLSNVGVRFVGH